MAKWGEGDPRWIVEEREDCKNVNNWHWTEKNATQWSEKCIREQLSKVAAKNEDCSVRVTSVDKVEGDATANNRKGKLIFFYEWLIEGAWEGQFHNKNDKTKYKGKFEVTNLSDENSADELDVIITCESTESAAHALKQFMHTKGSEKVREALGQYIKDLKENYGKDMILPSKNAKAAQPVDKTQKEAIKKTMNTAQPAVTTKSTKKKTITVKEEFFCTPDDLYRVLTTPDLVRGFTRCEAQVEAVAGGKFSLWGGNVTGVYKELVPGKSLAMEWWRSNWPADYRTTVDITLTSNDRGTSLQLTQAGVLEDDAESLRSGWQSNYFQAIKQTFGYGGNLF